jgi:hypothetical protein
MKRLVWGILVGSGVCKGNIKIENLLSCSYGEFRESVW